MSVTHRLTWTLVVPVKLLAHAKTRLAGPAGPHRERLALAIATDTVSAALACPRVRGVVVVTDDPVAAPGLAAAGAHIVPDEPRRGLNPALEYGAARARLIAPDAGVGALSADLPALRPAELDRALEAVSAAPNAFVPDAAGSGTTLYTARPEAMFAPAFGPESRARHRALGAYEAVPSAIDSVRRDVDTIDDLREALALGVGSHTAAVAVLLPLPSDRDRAPGTAAGRDRAPGDAGSGRAPRPALPRGLP